MSRARHPGVELQLSLFDSTPAPPEEGPALTAHPPTLPPDKPGITPDFVALAGEITGALTADERRYLTGPVVFHPGSDTCPDWLRAAIPGARVKQALNAKAGERDLATLEEALAYLSCASLAFPLAEEDARIFFWVSQTVLPQYGLGRDEPVWKSLGYDRPIELSDFEQRQLRDLRARIRAAVLKHARRREGEARERQKKARPS